MLFSEDLSSVIEGLGASWMMTRLAAAQLCSLPAIDDPASARPQQGQPDRRALGADQRRRRSLADCGAAVEGPVGKNGVRGAVVRAERLGSKRALASHKTISGSSARLFGAKMQHTTSQETRYLFAAEARRNFRMTLRCDTLRDLVVLRRRTNQSASGRWPSYALWPETQERRTRASVAKMAAGWDFFPLSAHAKTVNSVASAIDAYHRLSRPNSTATRMQRQAGLPILPRKPRRGRPPIPPIDLLVGRLGYIYARHTDKLGARSWDGAVPSDFERLVTDVLRVAGIRQSAKDAVARHIEERKRLTDIPNT